MQKQRVGSDVIRKCSVCRGLWFEQGQLDTVKDQILPEMAWLDIEAVKEQFSFKISIHPLLCPQCPNGIALTRIQDTVTDTEFCICVQCRGKWLTLDQVMNLIQLLLDEADKKSASELAVISLRQTKKLLMNAESNISDWEGLKSVLSLLKHRVFNEPAKKT